MERHLDTPPSKTYIGMVPFLLRHRADPVDELERRLEVHREKCFLDVMAVDHSPVGELPGQRGEGFPF
jgi:hypothetical protein